MSDTFESNHTIEPLVAETDESPWRQRFGNIYKVLRQRIVLLDYPPGMRLDIDALAEEFDVSRTPVRSVIQRLEDEGLALTRHGVGTTVTDIDTRNIRDALLFRMHLAELIGRLNPKPARVAVVEQLGKLHDECLALDLPADLRAFAHIDVKLHAFKCNLIGNALLRRTYDEMYHRSVRAWFHVLPDMDFEAEKIALLNDMSQTRNAILRGDVAAVGYITRNALSDGLYRLEELAKEDGTP